LRHDQRSRDVDGELPLEVLDVQVDQRSGNGDAGIVDQAHQRRATQHLLDFARRGRDGRPVGDVEEERGEARAKFLRQPIGIGRLAHAAEDMEARPSEHLHAGRPDAGRGSGDDDGPAGRHHAAPVTIGVSARPPHSVHEPS